MVGAASACDTGTNAARHDRTDRPIFTAATQLDLATRTEPDQIVFSGALIDAGNHHEVGHSEGTLTAVTPERIHAPGRRGGRLPHGQTTVEGELAFPTQTSSHTPSPSAPAPTATPRVSFSFHDTNPRPSSVTMPPAQMPAGTQMRVSTVTFPRTRSSPKVFIPTASIVGRDVGSPRQPCFPARGGSAACSISAVCPELEVDIWIVIQHKLVVASGCESRPGSCQEAR